MTEATRRPRAGGSRRAAGAGPAACRTPACVPSQPGAQPCPYLPKNHCPGSGSGPKCTNMDPPGHSICSADETKGGNEAKSLAWFKAATLLMYLKIT